MVHSYRAVLKGFVMIVAVAGLFLSPAAKGAQDAASVLASARVAMGGEAALAAVKAFTVSGTWMRQVGPNATDSQIEIFYEAPDRFLRRQTRFTGGGGPIPSYRIVTKDGFNGGDTIHETVSDAPFPIEFPGPPPQTPEGVAALAKRRAGEI